MLVTDRAGNIIDGLQPAQFHLFDNGKEQNIQVDVTFEPISLVVAIEASARVDGRFCSRSSISVPCCLSWWAIMAKRR